MSFKLHQQFQSVSCVMYKLNVSCMLFLVDFYIISVNVRWRKPPTKLLSGKYEFKFGWYGLSVPAKSDRYVFILMCFCVYKTHAINLQVMQWFYSSSKNYISSHYTAQKMKISIKDVFSKCDQIRRKLRIWLQLLKKSSTENFIFCAVQANGNQRQFISLANVYDRTIFARYLSGS